MSKIALVTGANRGLGLETCRQLAQQQITVILTCRNKDKGEQAVPLDVTDPQSCQETYDFVVKNYGRLDILVNNAGIFPDDRMSSALDTKVDILRDAMETNLYAPFRLCKLFIPLMLKNNYGRIVNLSSGMGQLTGMNGGCPGYRTSKTALNALTCLLADELKGKNVLINSLCPGWVKTDMGGAGASRELPEGADTIVWLATLPDGSASGGFFRDREIIPW